MVGQHPELYGFPELSLFAEETVGGLEALLRAHSPFDFRYPPGLLRSLAQLHEGTQSAKGIERAQSWLDARRDWSAHRLYHYLLEQVHPRVGVDKSPQTAVTPGYLRRAIEMYPHARFLHLTRHPVAAVRSLQRHLRPGGCPPAECVWYWLYVHRNIQKFTRRLPEQQVLRVRGEELLTHPKAVLPRIAAWLGVRTDAVAIQAMMRPEDSPYAQLGPENAQLGNDPSFLESPQLRRPEPTPPLQAPSDWGVDPTLWNRVAECARGLGYEGEGR